MMLRRSRSDRRGPNVVGLLDIGTSKVAAAIIVGDGAGGMRVAGLGMHRSKGVKAGVLTDLDAAEGAVRGAIGQAERAAGVTLDGVIVSLSAGRLKSQHFAAKADVLSGHVSDEDIARVMEAGRVHAERDGRALIHLNRLGFRLDGAPGVTEARGLAARQIAADVHAVTADEAPLRNLLLLIEHCYLACDGIIASPYASALAVTTAEEREIGVTTIDLGAGTASLAMFTEGHFVGADVIPVGSQHITFDIARTLQTPLAEAERIKTLYGTLISAQSDEHETLSYPLAGEEDGATYHTTKARLTEIIRPRFAQIFALLRERMAENPASAYAGEKIVLTGGASQLIGAAEFAANELGRPVRIGRAQAMQGLPASVGGPHFSTLAGLAVAAGDAGDSHDRQGAELGQGYLGRVGSWLRASF
ncbi:MAG: cell division protein FtsA [Hyphomicrobium sp.]